MMSQLDLDPLDWSKWRGGVDQSLTNINNHLSTLDKKVDELPNLMEKRVAKVMNGSSHNSSSSVTFKWVLEKIALPLIVSAGSSAVAIYAAVQAIGK